MARQTGGQGTGGVQSRRQRKEYSDFRFLCAQRARGRRDAPINRRRDVGRRAFSLFPPPFAPPFRRDVSVAYARVELLRSRAAGCSRRGRGTEGDRSTSSYRSATPLCAFPLLPLGDPLLPSLLRQNPRSRPCSSL